jgi:hypothetical protein
MAPPRRPRATPTGWCRGSAASSALAGALSATTKAPQRLPCQSLQSPTASALCPRGRWSCTGGGTGQAPCAAAIGSPLLLWWWCPCWRSRKRVPATPYFVASSSPPCAISSRPLPSVRQKSLTSFAIPSEKQSFTPLAFELKILLQCNTVIVNTKSSFVKNTTTKLRWLLNIKKQYEYRLT